MEGAEALHPDRAPAVLRVATSPATKRHPDSGPLSMTREPVPNTIVRPYGHLSVQEVDVPLTERSLTSWLLGREVYFQTDYLALSRGGDVALVAVRKKSSQPLFSPVVEVRVLAEPDRATWVHSPDTDVDNPTALARAALSQARPAVAAFVVLGRYEHVNFIWEPALTPVRVRDVVPPHPPKLFTMAEQAVALHDDLPPIDLILDVVDIDQLAQAHPAERYLLPCRGSATQLGEPIEFLDTRPPVRHDWLLIGCERSVLIHRHFYGDEPEWIDICPRRRRGCSDSRALVKCCQLERGIDVHGSTVAVPWGATLAEIHSALQVLTGMESPTSSGRSVRAAGPLSRVKRLPIVAEGSDD